MTRATKVKEAKEARQGPPPPPEPEPRPRLSCGLLLLAAAGLAGLVAAGALLWNDSREESARVGPDETEDERVGDLYQDTMGFSVAGASRFIGSGHPDLRQARRENLPPHLGLIESTDGRKTWTPISLLGEADFHVLRSTANVYGYDASNHRLLASADRGKTWQELDKPGQIVDLASDPSDPKRHEAQDGGRNSSTSSTAKATCS